MSDIDSQSAFITFSLGVRYYLTISYVVLVCITRRSTLPLSKRFHLGHESILREDERRQKFNRLLARTADSHALPILSKVTIIILLMLLAVGKDDFI